MVSLVQLNSIAAKHSLMPLDGVPVSWTGAASHVYPLGDVVVKIPFDRPDTIEAVTTESIIAPFVRKLDVQTPELIGFDDSRDIVPVPFAVFRRVEGAESLHRLARDPDSVREAWEEVGRQLARVHGVREEADGPLELRTFRQTPDLDPRPWVEELRSTGSMDEADARWLRTLLDELAPSALDDVPLTLCHGDVNAANVLVDERSHRFEALIDWSGAGWLDPAWDFAGVSLDTVPFMLAGHRSVASLPMDHTAEARICWCQVQTRLFGVRKQASPETARKQLDRHVKQIRHFAKSADLL